MDTIVIDGGMPLYGSIPISGAKNAALPLLAATLLAPGRHIVHNVPNLRDIDTMLKVLHCLGARWERTGTTVHVDSTDLSGAEAPYDLVRTMRASVLVLGPLLARLGRARVSLPGGCAIGVRPINYHIEAFSQLGAGSDIQGGYVETSAPDGLRGNTIYFDNPTVTGSENVLMAAALARGTTVIKNAAKEPEVGNLIDQLVAMGAEIEGKDSDRLTVHGVNRLYPAEARVIPDRIETGTYLICVGAAGGELCLTGCTPAHLPSLVEKLHAAGIEIRDEGDCLIASCPPHVDAGPCRLKAVNVRTMPYPGFPTDLQAQFMALMTQAEGTCTIHETIFENRFMHVAELRRMGADISIEGNSALVQGHGRDKRLSGAPVMATDLRASASLVIAALAARGTTIISRIYHLERGYESMIEKLGAVGARISRVAR